MPKERVLIAVKTYPVISTTYKELVCTAGFREDGSWIRLYPVPFRLINQFNQYAKYQWVEVNIAKNKEDKRPESYRIIDTDNINLLEKIGTEHGWNERRKIVLDKGKVFTNKEEIISSAHNNNLSLVTFKPTEVLDFVCEDADAEWPKDKVDQILNDMQQQSLFFDNDTPKDFKIVKKIPKKFSFIFKDDKGKQSKLMIEDWEIGQLYWNCLKGSTEAEAVQKVRERYLDDFARTKDLYFYLGTSWKFHQIRSPNPFMIIGTFHPPRIIQPSLF